MVAHTVAPDSRVAWVEAEGHRTGASSSSNTPEWVAAPAATPDCREWAVGFSEAVKLAFPVAKAVPARTPVECHSRVVSVPVADLEAESPVTVAARATTKSTALALAAISTRAPPLAVGWVASTEATVVVVVRPAFRPARAISGAHTVAANRLACKPELVNWAVAAEVDRRHTVAVVKLASRPELASLAVARTAVVRVEPRAASGDRTAAANRADFNPESVSLAKVAEVALTLVALAAKLGSRPAPVSWAVEVEAPTALVASRGSVAVHTEAAVPPASSRGSVDPAHTAG